MADAQDKIEPMRVLKPSVALYISLVAIISLIWFGVTLIYGFALVTIVALISVVCIFGLVNPIAEMLASRATQHRQQPSIWFKIDVESEQNMHSPLRAKRLFGHSIGKGDK